MQTIRYIFADGTASEIEVTDEFYTLYAELVQQEKRNHWKETRRHISLENLNENGIDFASPAADLLSVLIQQEDEKRIHKAMAALSDKQVVLNDYVLLNCDIAAGSVFATVNMDFYDTEGNIINSAAMKISVRFLSNKTMLTLTTNGQEISPLGRDSC